MLTMKWSGLVMMVATSPTGGTVCVVYQSCKERIQGSTEWADSARAPQIHAPSCGFEFSLCNM